jgi:serine/threonine protein kinase
VHRDLKPDNILISPKGVLIADFGVANVKIPKMIIGTKDYMAFEIRKAADEEREEEFTSKADVYSLGIISYEMFNGELPYINYRDERNWPLISKDEVPPAIKKLYSKMLKKNPLDRPSMREIICSDEFFHAIVNFKLSDETIERLRSELGPYKYGVTPFETGELEIKRFDHPNGKYYLGEVKLGTKIPHGRGVHITSSSISESWWKDGK